MASDLVIQFGEILETPTIFPDEQGKVQVTVTNQGDRTVTQPFNISLYASTDKKLDFDPANDVFLNERERGTTIQKLRGVDEELGTRQIDTDLNPGQSRTFTLDFAGEQFRTASVVSPGAYYLIAGVDSGKAINEDNEGNNRSRQFISTDGTDVVLNWNSTLLNAVQAEGRRLKGRPVNEELPIASPPFAARNAAIVHTAIYDAVMEASEKGISPKAAVVGAAYTALNGLYPEQQDDFDRQRQRSLNEIADGTAKNAGFNLGIRIANEILAERENDGASEAQFDFLNGDNPEPGVWRPTPTRGETTPNKGEALLPGWENVTPFGITNIEDVIPNIAKDGPPEIDGNLVQRTRYALAVNAVKRLGNRDRYLEPNTQLARNQAETAYFWSYDRPETFGPPGQWQELAQEVALDQGNTLEQNARLFAQLTTALANAGIAAWELKYDLGSNDALGSNQWRPISAIRANVARDGVTTDPDWEPLLDTPPFPDYVSGHAAFGGAAGKVLRNFFGPGISFDIPSQDLPGVSRRYNTWAGAVFDNAVSRVYGGIHIGEASLDGVIAGIAVGEAVVDPGQEV